MKPRFRQSINWLHTWTGFIFGWLLYFIFVTGSAGYFEKEIDRWMKPEMAVVNQYIDERQILDTAEQHLNTLAHDSPEWYIGFPAETAGGRTLYRMHYNLHYVPKVVGYILTSLATMLIGLITGVVIHKKIFIEFNMEKHVMASRQCLYPLTCSKCLDH
jgi:uncharacterized iron-regulated membrane protein